MKHLPEIYSGKFIFQENFIHFLLPTTVSKKKKIIILSFVCCWTAIKIDILEFTIEY